MENNHVPIAAIIYKQLKEETLSAEEQALLDEWIARSPENEQLLTRLRDGKEWAGYLSVRVDAAKEAKAYERFAALVKAGADQPAVAAVITPVHRVHFMRRWGWAVACMLLLSGGLAYYFLGIGESRPPANPTAATVPDIQPGKNGAILVLADGSRVLLDSIRNGFIALQGGARAKVVNGTLLYEVQGPDQELLYNTMSTPKGRQFQVTLPDGTGVWLNAASSIRYPTAFVGNERRVEVTGEVYFEVKKDFRPFIVAVDNRAEITVLGTSFNINSYTNETSIKATLLQGAVQVSKGGQQIVLRPGEQADVQQNIRVAKAVDLDKVMAWKAGLFNFEDVSLEAAMRQLERWYDITVIYEKGVPKIELEGEMSKDITLNGLMNVLKELGVHYRLEDRKLFIVP